MTLATNDLQQALERMLLERDVERFLYEEAQLLDERNYNAWLELLAEDIHYHMPIRRNIKFGNGRGRTPALTSRSPGSTKASAPWPGAFASLIPAFTGAEEPPSRFRHIVSNVRVGEMQGDEVPVKSCFFTYTNRLKDEVNIFVGERHDLLRRDPDTGWKIVKRTILLDQSILLAKVITTFF